MDFMECLFDVLEQDKDTFTIKLANKNHKLFQAHFPDNNILAGFLQIDIASNLLNINFKKIKKAKFISIIYPNDIVKYMCDTQKRKVIILKNENKMTEFIYE